MTTQTESQIELSALPVLVNEERMFFRAYYMRAARLVCVALEPVFHTDNLKDAPAEGSPLLVWDLDDRRAGRSIAAYDGDTLLIEPWPDSVPWTINVGNEVEVCIRAAATFGISMNVAPVVAEA